MRSQLLLLALLFFIITQNIAQHIDYIKEPIEIISSRSIFLNSGAWSTTMGGASRSFIKVDLPDNTIKWYYSFSTSPKKNSLQQLDLMSQLLTLSEKTQLKEDIQTTLEVPSGTCGIDIYLLDKNNIIPFLEKEDLKNGGYTYTLEGTVQNTKQAVVEIDEVISQTVYLGLKNPESFIGVNITIEVVAITKIALEQKKTNRLLKAELLGYAARDEYEKGNYTSCIQYCEEANCIKKLGWITAIKGLAELKLRKKENALQTFFEAIIEISEQPKKEENFLSIITKLEKIKEENPSINEVSKIIKMIEMQLK